MTAVRDDNDNNNNNSDRPSSIIINKIIHGNKILPSDIENLRRYYYNGNNKTTTHQHVDDIPYLHHDHLTTSQSPPSTTTTTTPSYKIVRYCGMIQDILDPEYYLTSSLDGRRYGNYRDSLISSNDDDGIWNQHDVSSRLSERQPMTIVPIPQMSSWFQELVTGETTETAAEDTTTMTNDDDDIIPPPEQMSTDDNDETQMTTTVTSRTTSHNPLKRSTPSSPTSSSPERPLVKKAVTWDDKPSDDDDDMITSSFRDAPPIISLRATFDTSSHRQQQQSLPRLNDVVHLVGIISTTDPTRCHVLFHEVTDIDAIVATTLPPSPSPPLSKDERWSVISILSNALFRGNGAAGEAFLLALTSSCDRHNSRSGMTTIPDGRGGRCSPSALSLTLVTTASEVSKLARRVATVVSAIRPVTTTLSSSFRGTVVPSKVDRRDDGDYLEGEEGSRLSRSLLQLPRGAALVVKDDGRAGRRNEEMTMALESIATRHVLGYDFGYSTFDFEADYGLVVISSERGYDDEDERRKRRCVPTTLVVNLSSDANVVVDEDDDDDDEELLSPTDIRRIRSYLSRCRRIDSITVGDEACRRAEEDFVARRRRDASTTKTTTTTEDDFRRWLTIMRAVARSRGVAAEGGEEDVVMEGEKEEEEERGGIRTRMATVEDWIEGLTLDDRVRATMTTMMM